MLVAGGIITPCVTATGAYYGLKMKMEEKDRVVSERVTKVEIDAAEKFVKKDDFKDLNTEVKSMHDDVTEIKAILKHDRR